MTQIPIDAIRASGVRRGLGAFAVAGLALAGWALAAAPPAGAVPERHRLVTLLGDHGARSAPKGRAPRIATVQGRRPLTNVRTVLPELDRVQVRRGKRWLRVALPGRPNSSTGWIKAAGTRPTHTPWHLSVRLASRTVSVYRYGRRVHRFSAVVGAPSTPTPVGRFFVEEAVALSPQDAGGPFALASSARSNVLQEFDGGPGQIAIHGRNHLSDPLGTAASHGCIRLTTRAITWLSRRIGAGVPLVVRR
jgi:lipoprotein-anchoring transpeptidase ErfK/SrfK